jgi:hypothetical protein
VHRLFAQAVRAGSDEMEARRLAKIAVDGHAVELWQIDRFIERFEPEH